MKLGVFQAATAGLDLEDRVTRLAAALQGHALDLVVCPELFATGYHIEADHRDLGEPAKGRYFQAVADVAKKNGCAIAYGYPEAAEQTYNSAAIVGADGALLANHRKRLASAGSFEEASFANGQSQTVFEVAGIQTAVAICYEIEFPETARGAALAGADLLIVPTALVDAWPVVAECVVSARAFENGLWVAYANHGGRELTHDYLGGSRIVAPDGSTAAVAGRDETLIFATVDRQAVQHARERHRFLRNRSKLRET